ncbi:MAG: DUF433 domain-containing protein [Armatimonadetes bacterium]|nr:DUF433 domain-containing protein [Armatimonadota bacterium]
MENHPLITIDPEIRSGKPCVRGMRITVADVLDALAVYQHWDAVIAEFPYITEDDIRACLAFAADRERKTRHHVA